MPKLIVAFRNFWYAPKMLQIIGLGQCCAYDTEFSMTVVKAVVVA